MNTLIAGLVLAEPSDGKELNSVTVSPGLEGFVAMGILAVVVLLLILSMTRHIRRINAQERVRQRMEQEQARQDSVGSAQKTPTESKPTGESPTDEGPTDEGPTDEDPTPQR